MSRCHDRSLVAALAVLAAATVLGAGEARVPSYTNDDLDRVAPLRGQTGVLSEVATTDKNEKTRKTRAKENEREERDREKAERTWRRAAQSHRAAVRRLENRIEVLERRKQAEERRRKAQRRQGKLPEPPSPATDEEIERVREQIREVESDFLDRARRDGALPGWLR